LDEEEPEPELELRRVAFGSLSRTPLVSSPESLGDAVEVAGAVEVAVRVGVEVLEVLVGGALLGVVGPLGALAGAVVPVGPGPP
jgi:hypothetical protein